MSTGELTFNLALLAYVLYSNLGRRALTRRRFTLPLILVAGASEVFCVACPAPATTSC